MRQQRRLIWITCGIALLGLVYAVIPRVREYRRSHSTLPKGECTWYAFERANENGWRIRFAVNWGRHARNWWEKVQNAERSDAPRAGAIMVLDAWRGNPYGHVAYVERVENGGAWRITQANMSVGNPEGDLDGVPVYEATCERTPRGIRFRGSRAEFRLRGFLCPPRRSSTREVVPGGVIE